MTRQLDVTAGQVPPATAAVIAAALHRSDKVSPDFFGHDRLGVVYRAYLIAQVLDDGDGQSCPPRREAAQLFCRYGLTGAGSGGWTQLYEHIGTVVAAAVTIARRMGLPPGDVEAARTAALLHDATKRRDVERHGALASSQDNTDYSLEQSMRRAGYPAATIVAAMNTGRDDRVFGSAQARQANIERKGLVAAIVGLADTRSIGAHFCSLDRALDDYLTRKRDLESQEFFTEHWRPYYDAVGRYLAGQSPGLDLNVTDDDIYAETVFPEVFGADPAPSVRRRYSSR